jgi:hypothetical protein
MTELVREIRGLIEELNNVTPLAIAALTLVLAILLVLTIWTIGGN